MDYIKKYWIFFVFAILIFIIILSNTSSFSSSNKDTLKSYLLDIGFIDVLEDEVVLEEGNTLNEYEELDQAFFQRVAFNYKTENFLVIEKDKSNEEESLLTLMFNLKTGEYTSTYEILDKDWFIRGTYYITTKDFSCNTEGYKGLQEYCDEVENKMKNYYNDFEYYLIDSKTDDYYLDRLI